MTPSIPTQETNWNNRGVAGYVLVIDRVLYLVALPAVRKHRVLYVWREHEDALVVHVRIIGLDHFYVGGIEQPVAHVLHVGGRAAHVLHGGAGAGSGEVHAQDGVVLQEVKLPVGQDAGDLHRRDAPVVFERVILGETVGVLRVGVGVSAGVRARLRPFHVDSLGLGGVVGGRGRRSRHELAGREQRQEYGYKSDDCIQRFDFHGSHPDMLIFV